ncbi:MAG: hypothetical protein V2I67_07200 [Thermoanaerobaculales bacterium]|nr:hypothetical protein [Thermoanaerobaculales bacterium]
MQVLDSAVLKPAATGTSLYLEATAHVAGGNDTNWRTDVGLHASGHEDAVISIELLRHGRDNSNPADAELTLEAGQSSDLEDVLGSEFGFTGKAALRITPRRGTLAVTSRTYNLLEEGNALGLPAGATFGQFIPAVLGATAIGFGDEGRLIQLSHNTGTTDGSRTNLGLVNSTGAELSVEIDLHLDDGELLGTVGRQLLPYEYRQLDRVFESVTNGAVEDGYAVVRPMTAGGAVLAYASIVDNLTGDPVAVLAQPEATDAGDPIYVVASAHVGGAAGTNWRTDLELHNGEAETVNCAIDLLEHGQANTSPQSTSVSLGPGQSRRLTDVLLDLFSYSGQAALRITPDAPGLLVTSRTYNLVLAGNAQGLPPGATFGQYIASIALDDALTDRDQGRLIQLAENDAFRTNLVLVNATFSPMTVSIELFANDGSLLGTVDRELAPYEYRQINRIFRTVTNGSVTAGYLVVRTSTPAGAFFALASVVDNVTGDPVAVPAIRYRPGTPISVFDAVTGMMDQLEQIQQAGISLEELASTVTTHGIEGLINAALSAGPDALTRTDAGLRVDWGTDGIDDQGRAVSGSTVLDLSALSVGSQAVSGSANETFHGFQVNGQRSLTDHITWTADLDVDPSGSLAGDLEIVGTPVDPNEPGLATIAGSVEIDTDVCPFYPTAGLIEFEIDDLMHVVTFGPQCDGSFGYEGPGGDLSQYHLVTIRVLNLLLELSFTDPDTCGDQTFSSISTFVWNATEGSFAGTTYNDSYHISYPPIEESNEVTVTLSSGLDRVGFSCRTTVVDSQDPESIRTRTTTISADDLPILFTGFGFETRIPGTGICDYITVQVGETYSSNSCVKQLTNLECRESSGIVVTIY